MSLFSAFKAHPSKPGVKLCPGNPAHDVSLNEVLKHATSCEDYLRWKNKQVRKNENKAVHNQKDAQLSPEKDLLGASGDLQQTPPRQTGPVRRERIAQPPAALTVELPSEDAVTGGAAVVRRHDDEVWSRRVIVRNVQHSIVRASFNVEPVSTPPNSAEPESRVMPRTPSFAVGSPAPADTATSPGVEFRSTLDVWRALEKGKRNRGSTTTTPSSTTRTPTVERTPLPAAWTPEREQHPVPERSPVQVPEPREVTDATGGRRTPRLRIDVSRDRRKSRDLPSPTSRDLPSPSSRRGLASSNAMRDRERPVRHRYSLCKDDEDTQVFANLDKVRCNNGMATLPRSTGRAMSREEEMFRSFEKARSSNGMATLPRSIGRSTSSTGLAVAMGLGLGLDGPGSKESKVVFWSPPVLHRSPDRSPSIAASLTELAIASFMPSPPRAPAVPPTEVGPSAAPLAVASGPEVPAVVGPADDEVMVAARTEMCNVDDDLVVVGRDSVMVPIEDVVTTMSDDEHLVHEPVAQTFKEEPTAVLDNTVPEVEVQVPEPVKEEPATVVTETVPEAEVQTPQPIAEEPATVLADCVPAVQQRMDDVAAGVGELRQMETAVHAHHVDVVDGQVAASATREAQLRLIKDEHASASVPHASASLSRRTSEMFLLKEQQQADRFRSVVEKVLLKCPEEVQGLRSQFLEIVQRNASERVELAARMDEQQQSLDTRVRSKLSAIDELESHVGHISSEIIALKKQLDTERETVEKTLEAQSKDMEQRHLAELETIIREIAQKARANARGADAFRSPPSRRASDSHSHTPMSSYDQLRFRKRSGTFSPARLSMQVIESMYGVSAEDAAAARQPVTKTSPAPGRSPQPETTTAPAPGRSPQPETTTAPAPARSESAMGAEQAYAASLYNPKRRNSTAACCRLS